MTNIVLFIAGCGLKPNSFIALTIKGQSTICPNYQNHTWIFHRDRSSGALVSMAKLHNSFLYGDPWMCFSSCQGMTFPDTHTILYIKNNMDVIFPKFAILQMWHWSIRYNNVYHVKLCIYNGQYMVVLVLSSFGYHIVITIALPFLTPWLSLHASTGWCGPTPHVLARMCL